MSEQVVRNTSSEDKLLGIELLRFASAIAVLVFHFQHFAFVGLTQPGFSRDQQPFYEVLKIFYEYGHYGVQVFWCLSGFIFCWKYANKIAEQKVDARSFFVLRWSRLYPLHMVTLLFVALAQIVYFALSGTHYVYEWNDLYHFALQLFMASNWGFQSGDSFNGPIWSISIEVLVYTLFFVALRLLSARPLALMSVLLAAVAVIVFKISKHPFFFCVAYFYVGCFAALAYGWARTSVARDRVVTLLAVMVVLVMPLILAKTSISILNFLFVFTPAMVFLCVRYIKPGHLGGRILTDAGNVTYASYLLHVPLQISVAIVCLKLGVDVPWRSGVFFIVYMAVILAASLWCHAAFEMPMQNWLRRRFMRKRQASIAS